MTDANLVLGRINPGYVLGGRMKLNREKAAEALDRAVAKPMGISTEQAALGIVQVVNSNMGTGAIRVYNCERWLQSF